MQHLFILRHSPYQNQLAREALDMALAFAAFDQSVSLVFCGDAVFQLLKQQSTEQHGVKNIEKTLAALPIYDIEQVFVCEASLAQRGLTLAKLSVTAKAIDSANLQALIHRSDKVFNF